MSHTTVLSQTPGEEEGAEAQLFRWLFFSVLRVRFSNAAFAELETWHNEAVAKANCSFRRSPIAGREALLAFVQAGLPHPLRSPWVSDGPRLACRV